MAELGAVTGFTLRMALDRAGSFSIETPDASLAVAEPDEDLRLNLTTALLALNLEDTPAVLGQSILAGELVEPSIRTTRPGTTCVLQGLDATYRLRRTQRAIRYVPSPAPQVLAEDEDADDDVETKVGRWTARLIAEDLLVGTDCTLFWAPNVRDYRWRLPFDGIGDIWSLLRRLVEPWDQGLGVDIYTRGPIVFIRRREKSPVATLSRTVATGRYEVIERRRRRRPLIGRLELIGMLVSSKLTEDEDGNFTGGDDDDPEQEEPSRQPDVRQTVRETKDASGIVTSRTTTTLTYRMPDRLLIKSFEVHEERQPTGLMVIVKEEEQVHTFDASIYGPRGPVNQPLPRGSTTTTSTRVASPTFPDTTVLAETGQTIVSYAYDEGRFLRQQSTSKRLRQPPSTEFVERSHETVAWITAAGGFTRVVKTTTTFDSAGAVSGTVSEDAPWTGGLPPGGPRLPGQWTWIGAGSETDTPELGASSLQPIRLVETLSEDALAERVTYRNENLDAADLAHLRDLFAEESGCYEIPVSFAGPAWGPLAVGEVLDITGYIPHGQVSTVALGPALVESLTVRYERGTGALRADGQAVAYA